MSSATNRDPHLSKNNNKHLDNIQTHKRKSGNVSADTISPNIVKQALSGTTSTKSLPRTQKIEEPRLSIEEIRKHSLIDKLRYNPMPPLREKMKAKTEEEAILRLASNFVGGGLVTGADDIDGMSSLPNFTAWDWLFDDILEANNDAKAEPTLKEISKGIKQFLEYSKTQDRLEKTSRNREEELVKESKKIAEKIHNLKPGQFQVIYGGWSNAGGGTGHGIAYEFSRSNDGTFDVYIYTSTGFQLSSDVLKGDKRRIKPVVHFKKVPQQDILFNDDGEVRPGFIQALTELNMLCLWDNNFIVDQEDVLEVFDHIAKYRVPVSIEEHGAITGQRAGTCVPSSTKAWIRAHSKNQGLYKQIMFQVKLRLLIATHDKLKEQIQTDSNIGAQSRILLKQVAKKLLRRTAKCIDEKSERGVLINEKLAQQAIATAHDIIQKVDDAEKKIDAKRKSVSTRGDIRSFNSHLQDTRRWETWVPTDFGGNIHPSLTTFPFLDLKVKDDAIDLLRVLETSWIKQQDLSSKKHFELANLQLHHVLDQLPLPKIQNSPSELWVDSLDATFWNQINDIETLESVIHHLHNMADTYRQSVNTDTATRKFATIFPLQTLIHFLSLKVDKLNNNESQAGRLESYQIPFRGGMVNDLEGLTYFDRHEYERFIEAMQYFNTFNDRAGPNELFENENDTNIEKDSVKLTLGNGVFWSGLISSNQALYRDLKDRANKRWVDYTDEQIQIDYQRQVEAQRKWDEALSKNQKWIDYINRNDDFLHGRSNYQPDYVEAAPLPGGNRPEPRLLQNLPEIQKITMLMEGSRDDRETLAILKEHGYEYLWPLRETTYWCHEWMHSMATPIKLQQKLYREDEHNTTAGVKRGDSASEKSQEVAKLGLNDHRTFSKKNYQDLFKKQETSRKVKLWKRGQAEVKSLDNHISDPIIKRIHRNLSEWKLTPYQMVLEMSKDIESLSCPEMQTLFYRLFFRSPVSKKETHRLGAGELVVDDIALYNNCKSFISKGISHFSQLKGSGEKKGAENEDQSNHIEDRIKGVRFYLELSFYLSKYLSDRGMEAKAKNLCSIDVFKRLFKLDKLSEQEKGTLHFYRLLFYSNYTIDDLNTEQLSEIYESWTFYNLYPDEREWKSPIAYKMAKRFINSLTTKLKERLTGNAKERSIICTHILKSTEIDNCDQDMEWQLDPYCGFPVIKVQTTEKDFYNIDLIKGKVYTPSGELSGLPSEYPWEQRPDFKRIFGDQVNFKYRALGGGNIGFKHPKFGSFRLIRQLGYRWGGLTYYSIQRQFADSAAESWYEYKEISTENGFPEILSSDHTFWIPVNKNSCKYKGYLSSLSNQQRKYALKNDGKIIEVDSKRGVHNNKSRFVEGDDSTATLRNFDRHILRFSDTHDTIQRVQFPRYTSIQGNPLAFSDDAGKLVWNENRQYYIPTEMPQGYLGTIPNYLYLKSSEKGINDKILVPLQPINISKVSYANGQIETENNRTIVPTKRAEGKEMWDKFQYTVFNVQNGELKPTNQESQLYLAYIKSSQKDYTQAIQLINTLNPLEGLSKHSEKILDLITSLPIIEDHPEAKMVLFHALVKKFKAKDKKATEKVQEYIESTGSDSQANKRGAQKLWDTLVYVSKALQSQNNIGIACRFDTDNEKYFLEKILSEYEKKESDIKLLTLKEDKNKSVENVLKHIRARYAYLKTGKPHNGIDTNGSRDVPKSSDGRNRKKLEMYLYNVISLPKKPASYDYTYQNSYQREEAIQKGLLFNRSKETYEEALEKYKRDLREKVSWLDKGTMSHQCTRPNKETFILKGSYYSGKVPNGALFLHVHRIAKTGSKKAREELLFKLKLWRIHTNIESDELQMLDLLLVMLGHPDSFPEPYHRGASDETKGEFLLKCKEAHCYSIDEAQELVKVDSPKQTHTDKVKKENFPISSRSTFDIQEKKVKDIHNKKQDITVDLAEDESRWKTLSEWKEYFTQGNSTNVDDAVDFSFNFDEKLLSNREKEYIESLKRDLRLLEKDYNQGKSINSKSKKLLLTEQNCTTLGDEVDAEIDTVSEELSRKMSELLEKANKHPKDVKQQLLNISRKGGTVQKEVTYDDCMKCFLTQDRREYRLKNPQIGDKNSANELAQLTLQVLDLKSHLSQLKRVKELAEKIVNIEDPNDITRAYLCKKLYDELDAKYHFNDFKPDIQIVLRTFSGETGMIPHKKQTSLIKKMLEVSEKDPNRFKDIVIQLIMGGGKTSVLATILMHIAARREGRLALFIVPSSLFDTVKINLGESLSKAFRTELDAVDMNREQMTKYNLERLIQTFSDAKNKGLPIVVKATTIQALELELLSQARHFKKAYEEKTKMKTKYDAKVAELNKVKRRNPKNRVDKAKQADLIQSLTSQMEILKTFVTDAKNKVKKAKIQLELLRQVVSVLPESADALIDEVDLILDSLQEVNFPAGERSSVKIERNNLLLQIYKTLVSDELKVHSIEGNPSVNDLVGLRNNEQSKLDKNKYLNHVIPVIANHLFDNFDTISEEIPLFKDSFIRFVTNKMPLFLEEFVSGGMEMSEKTLDERVPDWREKVPCTFSEIQNDLQFLKFIEQLYNTGDDEQKEAVNLIALTRHFLTELTPATLTKSGRRDYGIKPGSSGRIIPFLAVNTPATTEFGYHWEEACYYYQWAASFSPSEEQVLEMAKNADTMARYYIQKNGEKYEDTVEYLEFQKLFNVKLDEIKEPGKVEEGIHFIEKNMGKCLDLQFENVSSNVSYNTERLTSNGTALFHQLSSRRTMSGTPWNVEGYAKSLKERYEADLGTEGQILHALAEKKKDGKIFEAELSSIEDFLTSIFENHPTPKKIRGIIEAGGQFKTFKNNLEVARSIMAFIEKRQDLVDTNIEGVLFFHNDPGQDQPDTLYVWKKGATQPERIGGSSVDSLKAKGLEPKNYFTKYDERHTTGTDVLQLPDSINLFTFDEKMLRRTVGQGIMRLRQFLTSQDVEIVVTKKSRESIFKGGQSLNDLILHAEKVQSLRKTHDMVRYYQQQIDGIFRTIAVSKVIEALKNLNNLEKFCATIERFERFFVTEMKDKPYRQFGKLKNKIDTKKFLEKYLKQKLEKFTAVMLQNDPLIGQDKDSIEIAKEESKIMVGHIKSAESLPKEWEDPPETENLGVEQEVEVQQQVDVNQQIQVNLELETEVELELQRYEAANGESFAKEPKLDMNEFVQIIQNLKSSNPSEQSLQDQLRKYRYGFDEKPMPYDDAFEEPIYGTRSFFNTCKRILPVFHRLQRPAKQILAVQYNDKMHWFLLSERQAKSTRNHLKKLYEENDKRAENVWLIQPDGTLIVDNENADEFPIEEDYVDRGLLELNAFIGNADYIDKHSSDTDDWLIKEPELKVRFLKLKCARYKKQNKILRNCQAVTNRDEKAKFDPHQKMFMARIKKEKLQQGSFRPDSEVEAKLLKPKKLKNLNVDFVKHLGIIPEVKNGTTIEALQQLEKELPNDLAGNKQEALKQKAEERTKAQFRVLRPYQIAFVEPEQVKWLLPAQVEHLTKKEQFCTFKKEDGKMVPDQYLLSKEQIQKLHRKQKKLIPYVNPEYYSTFKHPWQIQGVAPEHIDKLHPNSWIHLSKEQMKGLSYEKVRELQNISLPPEKYGWIHGNLIEGIPPRFFNRIIKEQIQEIRLPDVIKNLEEIAKKGKEHGFYNEGQWTSWISPEMVEHINFDTQLKYLKDRSLILKVPVDQVKKLDIETQVPLIGKDQVSGLEDKQIPGCPKEFIRKLVPTQFEWLEDRQYPFLIGEEQIHAVMDAQKFALLKAEDNYEEGYENQMQWINDNQLLIVTKEQIKGLSGDQLLKLKNLVNGPRWEELREGMSVKQIQSMNTVDLVRMLSSKQIKNHLATDQVPYLKDEDQVRSCPDRLVPKLNYIQVKKIKKEQVKYLRETY
ncbi:MAG: DEAD/DEAH box helicase family protein, partial [Chlamydiota bacterium]